MGRKRLPSGALSAALGRVIHERLAIPQRQLAERIGVSEDTMTRWINGERPMTVDNLGQIAAVMGDPASELIRLAQERIVFDATRRTVTPPSQDEVALAADEGYEPPEDSEVENGA